MPGGGGAFFVRARAQPPPPPPSHLRPTPSPCWARVPSSSGPSGINTRGTTQRRARPRWLCLCQSVSCWATGNNGLAVVFWLGFWFWREYPGATLGRVLAPLAVVGTWGDQPPSGVVGGGPRATRRCHRRCGADLPPGRSAGAVFPPGGVFRRQTLRKHPLCVWRYSAPSLAFKKQGNKKHSARKPAGGGGGWFTKPG
jgi:hypothetical protein